MAAEPSETTTETKGAPFALPLRIRELKPSTRHAKQDRPSLKHGVRKRFKKPEKDILPMHEVTIPARGNENVFYWDVSICKYLQRVRGLEWSVPQFVSSDPSTKTLVIRAPVLNTTALSYYPPLMKYDSAAFKLIKKTLRSHIKLLYRAGLCYQVSAQRIYVLEADCHPGWVLYLHKVIFDNMRQGWTDAEWKAEEKRQYERVERIFGPIEELIAKREEEDAFKEAWTLQDHVNAVMREANTTLDEEDTRKKEAYARMKEANATVKQALATMKEAYGAFKDTDSETTSA